MDGSPDDKSGPMTEAEEVRALREELRAARVAADERRRHTGNVVLATILVVVVAGSAGFIFWQRHRAAQQEQHNVDCVTSALIGDSRDDC
jgi:hypothetical protein